MLKSSFLVATMAIALSTATAHAGGGKVLWTPPALALYPASQTIYCDAVNVGKVQQDVTFEVLDYYGNVTTGPITVTLLPETGSALGEPNGVNGGARCRFTATGSAKSLRAMAVYDNSSAYTVALPAQ